MNVSQWVLKNASSLAGKTVAISGATGGIGQELCAHLASLGASLILLDRNQKKAQQLANGLLAQYPALSLTRLTVDLEDMDSVKKTAEHLSQLPVDALILNAGAYHIPHHTCDTGFDNVFQINFVAPYYLARTLLPSIRERNGSVIAVSSIAHNASPIDPHDIEFSKRKASSLVYGNAKRYLTAALSDLSQKFGGVALVHPGITLTGITAHYPKWIFALIKHPMKWIFISPKKASLCLLQGIFDPCAPDEWIGPQILNVWGFPKRRRLTTIPPEEAEQIVSIANDIYDQLLQTKNGD